MIYHDTRRQFWNAFPVSLKFFGTTVLAGTAAILFVTTLQALLNPLVATQAAYQELTVFLSKSLMALTIVKLTLEAAVFRHLRQDRSSALSRTAQLMTGELSEITTARFLLGLIGGIVLPLAFILQHPAPGIATLGVTLWILVFIVGGELLERFLFFTASVSARMPGGIDA
jgi:hypothetical protein